MSTPYDIGPDDLHRFINDVNENVARDDTTDFKKLILYLFGFSHRLLNDLFNQPHNSELFALLEKLLSTVELVLSKKKYLVNTSLTPQDLQIVVSKDSPLLPTQPEILLYEWALTFAVTWLEKLCIHLQAANMIKCFLLELTHIIAVNLHSFKLKRTLRNFLLALLNDNVQKLLGTVSQSQSHDESSDLGSSRLALTIHIFTVINDYEVSQRLLLRSPDFQQKIEGNARKVAFILTSRMVTKNVNDSAHGLLFNCHSMFLLNLCSNISVDSMIRWSSVSFVLLFIHEYCCLFQLTRLQPTFNSVSYDRVVCLCLMKVYLYCRKKNLTQSFFQAFPMAIFDLKNPSDSSINHYPHFVLKLLHLMGSQQSILFEPGQDLHFYSLASIPFSDLELDELRSRILNEQSSPHFVKLDFLLEDTNAMSRVSEPKFNQPIIKPWLELVLNLPRKDTEPGGLSPLEDSSSIYTFISAVRNASCLIAGQYDQEENICRVCITMSKKNVFAHVLPTRRLVSELNEANLLYKRVYCEYLLDTKREDLLENNMLASNMLLSMHCFLSSFRITTKELMGEEPLLKFVLHCVTQTRNRDVRILAARVLPLFLINDNDQNLEIVFKKIFMAVSNIDLTSPSRICMAESSFMALANLAIVVEGEWLCVCFIKLIDSLGESNEQHVNLAYNSLLYVASARSLTPYKLLSPFLPSIAERIIKRERMLTKLTELLGVSKRFFLSNTRNYTTPRFLEYYKHDFVQEIAEASNLTKLKLISKTLPRIMATYLCKDESIDAKYIVNVLSNTSPSYNKVTTSDLIPNIGEILWYVLLQMQMDDDGVIANEKRIRSAIIYIAKINWLRRPENDISTKAPNEDEFDYIKYIFKEHVLELVQRFSEDVHQMKGIKPYLEKVSAIKAIQFIIQHNTEAASWALGQISTCLQAAMENRALEYNALQCWKELVLRLESRNLVSLFDISISMIFQKFQLFSYKSKLKAAEILEIIFEEIRTKYKKYVPYYYSYPFVKDLDSYFILKTSAVSMLDLKSKIAFFPELSRRLQTGNKVIVNQALDDLINSAHAHQLSWQKESLRDDTREKEVSMLVRTILDVSVHFRTKDLSISAKCAKFLGCLGFLDPNKYEFKTVKSQIIVLYDFHDYRENSKFLIDFIESKVIKIFWASNDPMRQLFSVYSMQCFLAVLGLDSSILEPPSQGIRTDVWNTFSETNKSTLIPLLSSRYFAQTPRFEPLTYPYYKPAMKHEKWLVDITTNLLRLPFPETASGRRGSNSKEVIFQTCSMLIRDQEISISQHLLKYVALSHILTNNTTVSDNIMLEFLEILKIDSRMVVGSERAENLKLCYQSVFEVIDYFNELVSSATQKLSDSLLSSSEVAHLEQCRSLISQFLDKIPTELIAVTSSVCDSYERTILYLEKYYRENEANDSQAELNIAGTLQSVYSNIDDYDSLDGVLKKFTSANLSEKLSTFQYNENWSIAQESFQVLSTNGEAKDQDLFLAKLLKSYSDHALYDRALLTLDSRLGETTFSTLPMEWAEVGLEESLVSGNLELIKKWLYIMGAIGIPHTVQGDVKNNFASGALAVASGDLAEFDQSLGDIYSIIGNSLSLSTSSSFSKNSTLMRQLHLAFDADYIANFVKSHSAEESDNIDIILDERLQNTDLEFLTQWQILSMHKLFNGITDRQSNNSRIFIKLAKAARNDRRLDIATKCIMNAMILNNQEASTEYAYLLWDQGKRADAIKTLADNLNHGDHKKKARGQLQYALWLDEASHTSSTTIIEEYAKSFRLDANWDRPFFELGKYFSKLADSKQDKTGHFERLIIKHYLHALKLGTSYIYEALPKLVTIWLDFAQISHKNRDSIRKLEQITLELAKQVNEVPLYVWYTCITQLLSRITHTDTSTFNIMSLIIGKLIASYPKHTLWYVLSHIKSKDPKRKERVLKVMAASSASNEILGKNINDAKELFEMLEGLAATNVKKKTKKRFTLSGDFNFKNTKKPYSSLVIPVKSNLEIRIPATHPYMTAEKEPIGWKAFPKSASITFDGFDEEVHIFQSLQLPKQITIRGTDNKPYRIMVKRDDTRKDAKVFEFTNMINMLLSKVADARKRNLVIENYSVIPLAEDMGIIEFVPDVATMKSVIISQLKKEGRPFDERSIFRKLDDAQKVLKANKSSDDYAKENLLKLFQSICEKASPILHQWFINQFSEPAIWYLARKTYTRTAAVMSIVGYIIGLGDRHCENILFFKKGGAVLHIDFDCLFDKGESLPTPEIVPFRLTQNLVDAMGITGIEGLFRITCEVTGALVRENEASLMNILETLIYDPLLDWRTHRKPQDHLMKVRNKIRGLLDKNGLAMNVHGQVDVLIQQATSEQSLSQMYPGWAAYL